MEALREWAYSLCCVCVIGSVISMITPDSSGKKSLGMIVSMIVLLVAFRPLVSLRNLASELKFFSSDAYQIENEELENQVLNSVGKVYESYLRDNLCRVLDGAGINYKTIDIIMDKSEDGCISIGQVEVIVQNEDVDNSDRIKRLLRDYIGFDPTVTEYAEKGSDSSGQD